MRKRFKELKSKNRYNKGGTKRGKRFNTNSIMIDGNGVLERYMEDEY